MSSEAKTYEVVVFGGNGMCQIIASSSKDLLRCHLYAYYAHRTDLTCTCVCVCVDTHTVRYVHVYYVSASIYLHMSRVRACVRFRLHTCIHEHLISVCICRVRGRECVQGAGGDGSESGGN